MKPRGWGITVWLSVAVLLMVGGLVLVLGANEEGLQAVIRATARSSAVLFFAAFSASSLRRLRATRSTRWLLANRRYVGVAFAASHFIHLGAVAAFAYFFPDAFVEQAPTALIVVGGGAYLFVAAMALTSTDRAQARLGRRWRQLHLVGGYYIWLVFAISYLSEPFAGFLNTVLATTTIAVLLLRILTRRSLARSGHLPR